MNPDFEASFVLLAQAAEQSPITPSDQTMSPLAAFRRLTHVIPQLLDQILSEKDQEATNRLCGTAVRLLGIIQYNLPAKDEFALSPEFSAALEAFRTRMAGDGELEEVINAR